MAGDSEFVAHEPCPECGSRDNLARYSDGHGHCFGCGHYERGTGDTAPRGERTRVSKELLAGEYKPLERRGLDAETLRKYDYRVGSGYHAATYYDADGVPVAQKVRRPGKAFSWVGDPKRAGLYGQHIWKPGRKVVVTEGEIDALTMAQVQGLRWPVVSVPNGAQGAAKSVAKAVEYLEAYDEVVFMFDSDEPGRVAARDCAELLTPGKARIAELPLKDPNEMLQAGRTEELVQAMWSARVHRPDGIVAGTDLWDLVREADDRHSTPYPWHALNEVTRGLRLGEVVTFTAGTGMGKSTVCREIAYDLVQKGERVGYVALEESVRRTAEGFMSIHLSRPLHLDRQGVDEAALREAFDATLGTDRVYLYDHWGSIESDHLFRKIRQLVRGCGVQWVVLDHISIVVSGLESANERKDLDIAMTRLRQLAEELNVGILVVSHLRRPQGKGHEEGAQVSLSDLRGSGAIAQLSDMVIALERNQQDDQRPNVAQFRVLKNRFTGETGISGAVRYNRATGRLEESTPFEDEDDGQGHPAFGAGAGDAQF